MYDYDATFRRLAKEFSRLDEEFDKEYNELTKDERAEWHDARVDNPE